MPTYQYRCNDCGNELEVFQKFSDDPLTVCPGCQGPLRKVFNAVGIVFKGSGFYATDSRSASKKSDTSSGNKPDASDGRQDASSSKQDASSSTQSTSANQPSKSATDSTAQSPAA